MRQINDARSHIGTTASRTDQTPGAKAPIAESVHSAPLSASASEHKIRADRALSDAREAVAIAFREALDAEGVGNTSLADGYYGLTESIVRRQRRGEYPLSLAHLIVGPVNVFRRVLTRSVVGAMGKASALNFFASCITELSKVSDRE